MSIGTIAILIVILGMSYIAVALIIGYYKAKKNHLKIDFFKKFKTKI